MKGRDVSHVNSIIYLCGTA